MPPHRSHPVAKTALLLALCFFAWVILFGNKGGLPPLTAQLGSAECNDGIDNDGDGLTDWQFDLSCVAQNDNSERGTTGQLEKAPGDTGAGWTNFEPSPDSRIIYVSSSEGSDSNNGLSPQTPVQTIAKAKTFFRAGYPDWLLLKRGDTWYETFSSGMSGFGGRSVTEPSIIASYGSSTARPLLKLNNVAGVRLVGATAPLRYVAVLGLEFYNYTRDPDSPDFDLATVGNGSACITMLKYGTTFWIEDIKCSFGGDALSLQGYPWSSPDIGEPAGFANVFVRRNVLVDAYAAGTPIGHSQGIFAGKISSGLLIEENIVDHNGWNADVPKGEQTVFNHNMYISSPKPSGAEPGSSGPATVRGNISARGSANCLQQRKGGETFNNLFLNCPLAMYTARNPGVVRGNVTLGGANVGTLGTGIGMEFHATNGTLVIEKNIVAHKQPTGAARKPAFNFIPWDDTWNSSDDFEPMPVQEFLSFRDNIAWNWRGDPTLRFGREDLGPMVEFLRNTIVETAGTDPIVRYPVSPRVGNWTLTDNRYFTTAASNKWVEFPLLVKVALSVWDPTGTTTLPTFPDPNRTIETYMASLGKTPTTDAFLTEARTQSKWGGWRNEYTAGAVNDYIRAGFDMTLAGGSDGGSTSSTPTSSTQLCFTLTPKRPGLSIYQAVLSLHKDAQVVINPQVIAVNQTTKKACFPPSTLSPLNKTQSYTATIRGKFFVTTTLPIPNLNATTPYPVTDILAGDFNEDGIIDLSDLLKFVSFIKNNDDANFATVSSSATFSDLFRAIIDAIRQYKEG